MHHHASALLALASLASAANHQVMVGASGMLMYNPPMTTAAMGDTVEFMWQGEMHSVTEGMSGNPCRPLSSSSFNSGARSTGSWTITITSTDPIYYYCGVFDHCQEGMVGGINVPSSGYSSYKSAAMSVQTNDLPSAVQGGTSGAPSTMAATSSMMMASSSASAMMSSASAMMSGSSMSAMMSSASAMMSSSSAPAMMSSGMMSSGMMASSTSAAASSSMASSSGMAMQTSSGGEAVVPRVAGFMAGLPVVLAALL